MRTCEIISITRDLVGNVALVRAEILEKSNLIERVIDTIKLSVEGGARMNMEELQRYVLGVYENG